MSLKKCIKKLFFELQRVRHFDEYGSWWNFRHGFKQLTVELNGITKANYREFMSDDRYRAGHPYNGAFSSIIDNKAYLPYLLKDYPQYVPIYYFFINKGIYSFCADNQLDITPPYVAYGQFVSLLQAKGKIVLKHSYSSLGAGFKLVECKGGKFFVNGVETEEKSLKRLVLSLTDYIATEYIQPHAYSRNICSTSVNTIRFLCVRHPETRRFYVARCFHRFGCEGSYVDNLGAGSAALFLVDIETGVLEKSGMMSIHGKEEYKDIVEYPNGKAYAGMVIPRFKEIRDKILEISESFPFLRYIGWDVAITQDGFKIIETNSLTSLGVLQRKGGYMKDPVLKRFFEMK